MKIIKQGFYHNVVMPKVMKFLRPDLCNDSIEHDYTSEKSRNYIINMCSEKLLDYGAVFDIYWHIPIQKLDSDNVNEILEMISCMERIPFCN